MPSALSAPLHGLLAQLGSGDSAQAITQLAGLHRRLTDAADALARAGDRLRELWRGAGAASAQTYLGRAVAAAQGLADHLEDLRADVQRAADAVDSVRGELESLIAEFEARAAVLEPALDTPGVAQTLADESRRAQLTAGRLVDDLQGRLSGVASGGASAAPPLPTAAPAGFMPPAMPWPGSAPAEAVLAAHRDTPLPDAAQFGAGEAVRLPDGSTVTAPNPVAAGAVRHALTQLGVPYQWGGTTAGVGLDCSGLTQWAYREAGLTIPRLAQEQDIGAPVDAGSLRPGDLAVWDGHVAMVVGNGTMIEAGDPVQLSPIRTTNAGQGFQGFWRPTA
ncbi:bifunctional WXG100 family type VII secretion target/C40 family peptidase [Mycobacterium sp. NPDC003323]